MTLPTSTSSCIELQDLRLSTRIGTYGPGDTVPEYHALDLKLWIDPDWVLIPEDGMAHVFDYDPLVAEIERLAADGHYETQERLMTRIVQACATRPVINALSMASAQISGAGGQRLFGRALERGRCAAAAHAQRQGLSDANALGSLRRLNPCPNQGVSQSQLSALICARRCPSRDNSNQSI